MVCDCQSTHYVENVHGWCWAITSVRKATVTQHGLCALDAVVKTTAVKTVSIATSRAGFSPMMRSPKLGRGYHEVDNHRDHLVYVRVLVAVISRLYRLWNARPCACLVDHPFSLKARFGSKPSITAASIRLPVNCSILRKICLSIFDANEIAIPLVTRTACTADAVHIIFCKFW